LVQREETNSTVNSARLIQMSIPCQDGVVLEVRNQDACVVRFVR
jgi:hypothetical protein